MRAMGYSPSEHVEDCKRSVAHAKLIAKHYPNAHREKIGGQWQWCHDTALGNATGFSCEVVEKKGDGLPEWDRFVVTFYPYHELREGDAVARVYASGFDSRVAAWDFMSRIEKRPGLQGAILAMLKEPK